MTKPLNIDDLRPITEAPKDKPVLLLLKYTDEEPGFVSYKWDVDIAVAHRSIYHAIGWLPLPALEADAPGKPTPGKAEATQDKQWPRKGDRMRFLNKNGYDNEREHAATLFDVGKVYEVEACEVGDWNHYIKFAGIEGRHNGVMFELAASPSEDRGELRAIPVEEVEGVRERLLVWANAFDAEGNRNRTVEDIALICGEYLPDDLREAAALLSSISEERDKWKLEYAAQVRAGLEAVAEAKAERDYWHAAASDLSTDVTGLDKQLAEAKAEIEGWKHKLNLCSQDLDEAKAENEMLKASADAYAGLFRKWYHRAIKE